MLLVQQKSVLLTRAMQVIEQQLGEPLEGFLRRRYEVEGRTTVEIAEELDVNSGTVSRWMAHFGIPARLTGSRRSPEKVAV
jgi:DNA-binding NarL/FixJ family response regulator